MWLQANEITVTRASLRQRPFKVYDRGFERAQTQLSDLAVRLFNKMMSQQLISSEVQLLVGPMARV